MSKRGEMRSKRKHVGDEKRPAMFYGRCAAFRAALRFYIPRARKHARFRGRNMKIQNAFTARCGRVTMGATLRFRSSPNCSNSRSTAPFRVVRPLPLVSIRRGRHLIVVIIVEARYPWTSGRGLWKVVWNKPRSMRIPSRGINDCWLGNYVFKTFLRELVPSYMRSLDQNVIQLHLRI